jgi:hypothetical protein
MKKLGGWPRLGIFISVLWTISIITFCIYEHNKLQDNFNLKDIKPFIFWKWETANTDFNKVNLWDIAAKTKGIKTWNEVLLKPEFQILSEAEKEEARNQYWQDISSQFQNDIDKDQIHAQFDKYSKRRLPLSLHPYIFRILFIILLPIIAIFSFAYGINWIRQGFQSHIK